MYLSKIIGHRGCAGLAPENSREGIILAAQLGLTSIEVDLSILNDGSVVVFHDDYLQRCTNSRGALLKSNWEDLKQVDCGAWFSDEFKGARIMQLAELLKLCKELDLRLNLELKVHKTEAKRLAKACVKILAEHWPEKEGLVISSFSHRSLRKIAKLAPHYNLGVLFRQIPWGWKHQLKSIKGCTVHAAYKHMNNAKARRITEAGYPLYLYTVNRNDDYQKALSWGVSGVFSDFPNRLDPEHQQRLLSLASASASLQESS